MEWFILTAAGLTSLALMGMAIFSVRHSNEHHHKRKFEEKAAEEGYPIIHRPRDHWRLF